MSHSTIQFSDNFSAPIFNIPFSKISWDTQSLPSTYGHYLISADDILQKKELRGVRVRKPNPKVVEGLPWTKYAYTGTIELTSHNHTPEIVLQLQLEDGQIQEITRQIDN